MVRIVSKLFPLRFQIWHTVFHTDFVFVRKYKFVESLVGLKGVNRHVKTNTQTFIKFTLRHCRSGGRHCRTRTAAVPHLLTTSIHSSKFMNENLNQRNFLLYCRYDNHRSRARSSRSTTHK